MQIRRAILLRLKGLTIVGLFLTVVSWLGQFHWVPDLISHLRVQLAVGAFIICLGLILLREWKLLSFAALGFVLNLWPVLPYYGSSDLLEHPAKHRLLTFNVLTSNSNTGAVIETIRENEPDYILLMEVDDSWESALTPLLVDYPNFRFQIRQDNFGMAFLSKKSWSSIEALNPKSQGLPAFEVRFDDVELASGYRGALKILGVHPIPPMNRDHWQDRNEYLEAVLRRVSSDEATIVSGDFNLTPWSPVYRTLTSQAALRDSSIGFGVQPTFAWYPFPEWISGVALDITLVSKQIEVVDHRTGPKAGSDHRPLIVDF